MTRYNNTKKGFTLFVALVVSSAVLLGSYAISNAVYRQIRLSGVERESQKAFTAADSGLECARYYDHLDRDAFSTTTSYGGVIECADNNITVGGEISSLPGQNVILGGQGYDVASMFQLDFGDTNTCAVVKVTKTEEMGYTTTRIESRGYNTCDIDVTRRVERALRLTF